MRVPTVLAALPLLACVACRSTTDSPAPRGEGLSGSSASGEDAGNAFVDAGSGGSVNDGAGGTTGVGDASLGETLTLLAYGGASGEVATDVSLTEPGVGPQETCTNPLDDAGAGAGVGACQITECQAGGIGSPSSGYGDFGPISASVGATTVNLTYDGAGYGTVYFPSSVTLGGGGTMTFRGGDGTTVPVFDVTATIPDLAVITSPLPPGDTSPGATADGGTASIDTAQDLSVAWTPMPVGQFNFVLQEGSSDPGTVTVTIACAFDGASGQGTVPRALLSAMKGLSGTNAVYASVSSTLTQTTVVGGLTIVTQSYESSPTAIRSFGVTFE